EVGAAGIVNTVANEDQCRRENSPPDAIHAKEMPCEIIAEEPEQAGNQQRKDQVVLVDAAACRVEEPAEEPRENGVDTVAQAGWLVEGSDKQDETRPVDAADEQAEQLVVLAAGERKAEQDAEDGDGQQRRAFEG